MTHYNNCFFLFFYFSHKIGGATDNLMYVRVKNTNKIILLIITAVNLITLTANTETDWTGHWQWQHYKFGSGDTASVADNYRGRPNGATIFFKFSAQNLAHAR